MDTRFSISNYVDAKAVTEQLEALIKLPMHSIAPDVLKKYEEEYYDSEEYEEEYYKSNSCHCCIFDCRNFVGFNYE